MKYICRHGCKECGQPHSASFEYRPRCCPTCGSMCPKSGWPELVFLVSGTWPFRKFTHKALIYEKSKVQSPEPAT